MNNQIKAWSFNLLVFLRGTRQIRSWLYVWIIPSALKTTDFYTLISKNQSHPNLIKLINGMFSLLSIFFFTTKGMQSKTRKILDFFSSNITMLEWKHLKTDTTYMIQIFLFWSSNSNNKSRFQLRCEIFKFPCDFPVDKKGMWVNFPFAD